MKKGEFAMPITAACKFDEKSVSALGKVSCNGRNRASKRAVLQIVMGAVIIVYSVLMILLDMQRFGCAVLGFGVAYLIFHLSSVLRARAFSKQSAAQLSNRVQTFSFYESYVNIVFESPSYSANSNLSYSGVVSIVETGEYIFIFRDKLTAYIVDKSTVSGSVDDLRSLLTAAVGIRYKMI